MPGSRDPKPSRARKPAARKPAAAKKTAAKKTVAKKTVARKTAARKTAARKTTPRTAAARKAAPPRRAGTPLVHDEPLDDATPQERPRLSRPVAIGVGPSGESTPPAYETPTGDDAMPPSPFDEPPASPGVAPAGRPEIEDPRGELIVGVLAAVTAVAVFLPWYKSLSFVDTTLSGWSSGTWGPVVFFASLAAIAIVGLRRAGVALAFPVSYALVLEGIGWLTVIGLFLKRLFTPTGTAIVGVFSGGYWLAIAAGVLLALAAGRLSKDAPFVTVPGWFKTSAGKAGAGVLALSLVAGAAFGLANDFGSAARPAGLGVSGDGATAPQLQQGLPKCISESSFPVPDGVTPEQGFGRDEPEKVCTAIFSSDLSVKKLDKAYRSALKGAGWTFEVLETPTGGADNARVFSVTAPECGTLQILNTQESRSVSLVIGPAFCRDLSQFNQGSPSN